jgi:hypothetical protein
MSRTALYTAAGLVVVLAAGLVHGLWTDRWQVSPALADATARLDRLPLAFGDWQGQAVDLDQDLARLGASRWLARRYENGLNKASLSILLVCGHTGRISVHTPDVCYGGAGYETLGEPTRQTLRVSPSAAPAELWTTRFSKQDPVVPSYLRIFWTWRPVEGGWSAPDNPRFAFARSPALTKLYVIRPMASPDEPLQEDPALPFIRQLLAHFEDTTSPGDLAP